MNRRNKILPFGRFVLSNFFVSYFVFNTLYLILQSYEHHFKHLDQDKNGALNSTELSRWIIPQYDPHEAEADRLISDGDTNSDRLLSNEEIAKNSGHFHTLIPAKFWKRYWDDGGVFAHDEF